MPQLNPFPHESGGRLGPSDSAVGRHDEAAAGPGGPVTRAPSFLGPVRYRPAGEHDVRDVLPAGGRMPPARG